MGRLVLLITILCVGVTAVVASPLKNVKIGDILPVEQLESETDLKSLKGSKVLLVWDDSKRLSTNTYATFKQVCAEKGIVCIALNLGSGADAGLKPSKSFIPAKDTRGITSGWGLFTLPVTVYLNPDNTVREMMGFEGQYERKLANYIDLMLGKISPKEIEALAEVGSVDKSRSRVPELNFVIRLILDGQKEDAQAALKKVDPNNMDMLETGRYVHALLMLQKPAEALAMLDKSGLQDVGNRYYRAVAYADLGRVNEALDLLLKLEPLYPDKQRLYKALGKIYLKKGEYEKAAKMLDRAVGTLLD